VAMEEEDKCTVLHHPMGVTGGPEQKSYSYTKHCTGSFLYINFLAVVMMVLN